MAVKIKLTRLGSKKHPFYRIVATNLENARDSRPLEFLGHYNPMLSPAEVVLDAEKIQKWLDRGAIPTDTVRAILKDHMPKAEA
ncbi:MAG: 30S ribosomal protein S16 [Desulfovibrio sp.]|jgi:small subunit ribosomal protein S16|nr:30S ribosomal protein S16 [Desulfovibrio sp.]MDD7477524.1 30S ribosomal protein S16 [Desulfovibrio sp.]MDY5487116.1 30S ribosomal protein S16 [Desulfovibrio sp.]MEE0406371.1 30S ribosomal protein S16 [Desulfovibrio sp.]